MLLYLYIYVETGVRGSAPNKSKTKKYRKLKWEGKEKKLNVIDRTFKVPPILI